MGPLVAPRIHKIVGGKENGGRRYVFTADDYHVRVFHKGGPRARHHAVVAFIPDGPAEPKVKRQRRRQSRGLFDF